jgi:hypothetical protein
LNGADRLNALIAAVRRRWFITVALRTAGGGMAAAALPLLAGVGAYWMFAPRGVPLLILASAAAVLAGAAAFLIFRGMEPRPDDTRVARFVEERLEHLPSGGPLDDTVVSAIQAAALAQDDPRRPFAGLVVAAALRRLEGIEAPALVPAEVLRRAALTAACGTALMMFALVLGGPPLGQAWQTARLIVFPQSISVEVLPGDVRIAAGRPLTIRVRLRADGRAFSAAKPSLVVSSGADQRTVEMRPDGDGFSFGFESIDRTFGYKVTAGAITSADYTVTALFPPRVKRIDLRYQYPSFTGLAPRGEEDGGDIFGPAGTRVRIAIHTDKPVVSGQLGMAKAPPDLRSAGERILEADLVLAHDDSYRVRLRDHDGLESDGDSEYFIRVMEDRPPDVRILRPGGDQGITPLQEISIEARAEDDYGVASLDLVYSVAGGKEHVVPFRTLAAGETQRTGAHLLAAEELDVRPGDVIAYYARARDVARGRRSIETKSDLFFLEVKPFNEEFVAAQSQASAAAGGDPQIDSLIQAQKDIISATWNIERRSAGGRSAEDVKAIAQAQADLKTRAEQVLAGTRGRRGRGVMPPQRIVQLPQPRPSAGSDPVGLAVEAMARALEQLASSRTRDAIPHEMSALNGLLQAQADVRRRQISQQARGAGNGGNRQTQDLSALFDKELQRQQQTNYEQRSPVEERQTPPASDQAMADRIKDLARRQEEISHQQQLLAQMNAEQRRRELERLAREQQELQRQTEELSKQMTPASSPQRGSQAGQQQQSSPAQQGQQSGQQQGQSQAGQQQAGQQGGGNPGMRSAAEQMRRATEDMRREDGESAARSGQRAADELRKLEAQMRGGADARERAAADLQAEAQQIAQEQRRIASEAERMEKNAGADARRRLAADKDRLSERVDALKREAQRLAEQPVPPGSAQGRQGGADRAGADEQSRARAAAGELERQQVAERMRASAQQMREGTKPPSGQGEGAIARTLDQVVEKLGGATSADARKLAEQLDRSRETRERLDSLESQIRAAEGTQDGRSQKLRQQYQQELGRARAEASGQAGGTDQRDGARGSTPEQHEFSRSAPGTEAYKQDRAGWEALRKDVNRALESRDAAVSRQLAKALGEDRFNAGGSERVPEHYRRLVARYYESLARARK